MLFAPPAATCLVAADTGARRESRRLEASTYLARGLEYLRRPRPEDLAYAETLLRKALRRDAGLAAAHAGLARMAIRMYTLGLDETRERLEYALEEAQTAVELAPRHGAIRATFAMALAADDRLTPALEEARRAVELDPQAAGTHTALSVILRLRRDLDAAVGAGQRAAAIEPHAIPVLVALAAALRESGEYESALELYGQAIDLDPEAIVPQLGSLSTLQRASRFGLAARGYEIVRSRWDYAETRTAQGLAALLVKAGDYQGALQLYGGIELPENGALPTLFTLYGKGYCLLRLDRPAEAEYFLSTMLERIPGDYDGPARGREILFRAFEDLAGYFEARGRVEKVERLLRDACARPRAPTRLAARLATLLEGSGRAAEGAAVLETVILAGDPHEDPIALSAGILQLIRLRSADGKRRIARRSDALAALRTATGRIGTDSPGAACYRLARAQALARLPEEAIASLVLARDNGYLPLDLMETEGDFATIRDAAAFRKLLDR